MTTKTLIRGGTVVSMDPQLGDLTGDVLIEDDKIPVDDVKPLVLSLDVAGRVAAQKVLK